MTMVGSPSSTMPARPGPSVSSGSGVAEEGVIMPLPPPRPAMKRRKPAKTDATHAPAPERKRWRKPRLPMSTAATRNTVSRIRFRPRMPEGMAMLSPPLALWTPV